MNCRLQMQHMGSAIFGECDQGLRNSRAFVVVRLNLDLFGVAEPALTRGAENSVNQT
jgi:hypothetical protein